MILKYFILYTSNDGSFKEFYFKAKTYKHLDDRIKRYCNGLISTNKFGIVTSNIDFSYLREIDLRCHPELNKNDFAIINENRSYCLSEINDMDI